MEASTGEKRATVFGGTGFLGRAVVARLDAEGARVRIAVRHPDAGARPAGVEAMAADLRDAASVARAVADADWVVNAVGLYQESRGVIAVENGRHNVERKDVPLALLALVPDEQHSTNGLVAVGA